MAKSGEKKDRFLFFYITSMTLFISLAVVGYYFLSKGMETKEVAAPQTRYATEMTYIDLPRVTISLTGAGLRQAEVDISLEVLRRDVAVIDGYIPQIMDKLNVHLPKVRYETIEQPRTMFILRKDTLWQVNSIEMPAMVHDVVFRRMVVM